VLDELNPKIAAIDRDSFVADADVDVVEWIALAEGAPHGRSPRKPSHRLAKYLEVFSQVVDWVVGATGIEPVTTEPNTPGLISGKQPKDRCCSAE
jgi:hypothetical protein